MYKVTKFEAQKNQTILIKMNKFNIVTSGLSITFANLMKRKMKLNINQ